MKALLLTPMILLTGCATLFDTPVPKYDVDKTQCSVADYRNILNFLAVCKKKGYSDSACYDYGVYRHCGEGNKHKLMIFREDI